MQISTNIYSIYPALISTLKECYILEYKWPIIYENKSLKWSPCLFKDLLQKCKNVDAVSVIHIEFVLMI